MNREAENGWRVGDLAVCIAADSPWLFLNGDGPSELPGPKPEQVVRVASVFAPMTFKGMFSAAKVEGLSFDEFPDFVYPAPLFRKVKPDAEAADDAELVALIKRFRVGADA